MLRLLISALFLGIGTDLFIIQSGQPGLGCLLFVLIFIGSVLITSGKHKDLLIRKDLLTLSLLLVLGGITFVLFDSTYAQQLATLGVMFLGALFLLASAGFSPLLPFEQYVEAFLHMLESLPRGLGKMRKDMREATSTQTRRVSRGILQVVAGLIALFPIGAIFLSLFTSADPVFKESVQNFMEQLFQGLFLQKLLEHSIFIPIFFLFWLVPLSAVQYLNAHAHKTSWDMRSVRENLWVYIVFGGLALLFGIFLSFQGFYLFGGIDAFKALDVTYADYAKQGFGQLIAVAVLILGLASAYHVFATKQYTVGRTLLSVLIIETFAVLISALVRLTLYVDAYGLTPARHAGYWGLAMVAGSLLAALILTWLHEYRRLTPAVIVLLFALGSIVYPFFMPDRAVAKHNIAKETSFSMNETRAYGSSVGADGLALYLPYYSSHLPVDFTSDGDYTKKSSTFSKSSLCGLRTGVDTPTIDVFEGYQYGTNEFEGEKPSVRNWFDSLNKKQNWDSWNLSRAKVRSVYTEPPAWVNFDSAERLAAYCAR